MSSLASKLKDAGVSSLEIQTRAELPAGVLVEHFATGWPPYDQKMGVVAYAPLPGGTDGFYATLVVSPEDGAWHTIVLIMQPGAPPRMDLSFDKIQDFFTFLKKGGHKLTGLRGVVHTIDKPPKALSNFPIKFNRCLDIVGLRFNVHSPRLARCLENAIVELVGDRFHQRLATKKVPFSRFTDVASFAKKVLNCRKELVEILRETNDPNASSRTAR